MSAYGDICGYEGEASRAFSTLNMHRASTSYCTENVDYDEGLEADADHEFVYVLQEMLEVSYLARERARKQYEAITIL